MKASKRPQKKPFAGAFLYLCKIIFFVRSFFASKNATYYM